MKKLRYLQTAFWSVGVGLLLAGCGTSKYGQGICDPSISQLGPDTFYASASCATPGYAIAAASNFCRQNRKQSLVQNIKGDDVIFRCLNSNDSENQRPTYQKSPNVIIQDNRR